MKGFKATAYHEAGHAVSRIRVGFKVAAIEVRGREGTTYSGPDKLGADILDQMRRTIVLTLAGPIAEGRGTKRKVKPGDSFRDFQQAKEIAAWLVSRGFVEDKEREFSICMDDAHKLVCECWPDIERVAAALMQRGRLEASEIAALIEQPQGNTGRNRQGQ